ncbi:MFS transporter [bacterium]|nr:MFS transporter [bacterium]
MLRRFLSLEYKYLVAAVFIFGMFMDMVDMTVVNVAIPDLSREFHASTSAVEWTVTGYMLSLAVFIPAAGFLSDRFGTKRCFLIAMAIFVAASGLCGQAHSLNELIAFRVLQGIGGGMMTPVGTAMLSRSAGAGSSTSTCPSASWASSLASVSSRSTKRTTHRKASTTWAS